MQEPSSFLYFSLFFVNVGKIVNRKEVQLCGYSQFVSDTWANLIKWFGLVVLLNRALTNKGQ